MKKFNQMVLFALLALPLCNCANQLTKSPVEPKWTWKEKMYGLSHNLAEVLSLTSEPIKANDSFQRNAYVNTTRQLSKLAQAVAEDHQAPDQDPSLRFIARRFAEDSFKANQLAELGHLEGSRYLLNQTTNYCVSCHSRSPEGKKNTQIPLPSSFANAPAHKKAQFYAATRQFKLSLSEYEKALTTKGLVETDPSSWEEEMEKYLALVVRVEENPKLALETLSKAQKAPNLPGYLERKIQTWKASLNIWVKEASKKKKFSSGKLLKKAKVAIVRGQKLEPITADRTGMVEFLRASSYLHEILKTPVERDKTYGEALFYAGQMSEHLKSLNLWTMHEAYYEACIRYQPYTELAKNCYHRLEELKLSSKSYWNGQGVTPATRQQLFELKNLVEKRAWKASSPSAPLSDVED